MLLHDLRGDDANRLWSATCLCRCEDFLSRHSTETKSGKSLRDYEVRAMDDVKIEANSKQDVRTWGPYNLRAGKRDPRTLA